MQLTYSYEGLVYSREGYPKVALVVDIPKLRTEKLEPKKVAEIRANLLVILRAISDDTKGSPENFAQQIFKTVRSEYQTIALVAVVFTVDHEGEGQTSLTYTSRELDLTK
jgi:hypothetical protein